MTNIPSIESFSKTGVSASQKGGHRDPFAEVKSSSPTTTRRHSPRTVSGGDTIGRTLKILLNFMDEPAEYAVKVNVPRNGTIGDIVDAIQRTYGWVGLDKSNVVLVELINGKVHKTMYSPRFAALQHDPVHKIIGTDILAAFQVPRQFVDEPRRGLSTRGVGRREHPARTADPRGADWAVRRGVAVGDRFGGVVLAVEQLVRNVRSFDHTGPPRLYTFPREMSCQDVHHKLWDWASTVLVGREGLDPHTDVYQHHVTGVFDPNAGYPRPSYVVCLSDHRHVRRLGQHDDMDSPIRTLPYSTKTVGSLHDHHGGVLGLMVTFAPYLHRRGSLVPAKDILRRCVFPPPTHPPLVCRVDVILTVLAPTNSVVRYLP
jgi:hypothetical protein